MRSIPELLTVVTQLLLAVASSGCARSDLTIVGRIVDETGAPVVGARVEWQVAADDTASAPTTTVATESREDGSFELPRVPRNRVRSPREVDVAAPGHARVRARPFKGDSGGGNEFVVTLPRAVRVRGRCVDASGRPLAGVRVQDTMAGSEQTTSGPDGRFDVERVHRKPGIVTMSADGWVTETRRQVPGDDPEFDLGDVIVESAR